MFPRPLYDHESVTSAKYVYYIEWGPNSCVRIMGVQATSGEKSRGSGSIKQFTLFTQNDFQSEVIKCFTVPHIPGCQGKFIIST